jgi:hypothetical protein
MKSTSFIKDSEKYNGKYVATQSFSDHTVISSGSDAKKVRQKAQKLGCNHPVVFYVPQKGTIHVY